MITYSKLRKLNVELAEARDTSDTLDDRITGDDVVLFTDITSTPSSLYQIFYQATAPSSAAVDCVSYVVNSGDYWVDSDDNQMYKYDGTDWNSIQDIDIADGVAAKALTDVGFDANGNLITSVIPASNVTPDGTGLYLGAEYMGYYASGEWITYLDNSGNFYLGGTSGALQWNGSTLSIVGSINITGTSSVGQLLQVSAAGKIRSNDTGTYPYLEMSNDGLQLKDSDTGGTVGTAVVNTDLVGFGATVWIMNADYDIPWMETKEPQDGSANDMPSIRLFERDADPTGGTYIQGDLCNTSGFLKSYYNAGWRTQCMIISTTAASSGVGSVKMGSVNAADNAGWIEVDTNKFVPYWSDETP